MDPEPIFLPEKVWQGIELINRQEYFAAHELLEIAWREEPAPIRHVISGITTGRGWILSPQPQQLHRSIKEFQLRAPESGSMAEFV